MHDLVGLETQRVASATELTPGPHTLGFGFLRSAEHRREVTLWVDDVAAGSAEVALTPTRFSLTGAGLTSGHGHALAVTDDYDGPFPFTGVIERSSSRSRARPPRSRREAAVAIATQ